MVFNLYKIPYTKLPTTKCSRRFQSRFHACLCRPIAIIYMHDYFIGHQHKSALENKILTCVLYFPSNDYVEVHKLQFVHCTRKVIFSNVPKFTTENSLGLRSNHRNNIRRTSRAAPLKSPKQRTSANHFFLHGATISRVVRTRNGTFSVDTTS